jgi:adenylate cyclase
MINEFEGDGILAIFGAPLDLPDHAVEAVRAGRAMLEAVEALNATWADDGTLAKWRDSGVQRLAIRVGLHTGTVVAGNVGSEARIKYAVIGDTVNVAARVEALNKTLGTPMLLTGETARALGDSAPALQPMGAHAVKGRVEPVEVFALEAPPVLDDHAPS